jgi:pimeloyl-ACP methyl ester carboxylesterase
MRGYPERPALVFLHFFGGSARTWDPVLEELQDFETLRSTFRASAQRSVPQAPTALPPTPIG